jgi:hypothetical protein
VLDRGRPVAAGDVEVGHDERVAVDRVEAGELVEQEVRWSGGRVRLPAGSRIRADLTCGDVEADPADQQPGRGRPPVRGVVGDGDLRAGNGDRVGPVCLADAVEQSPQRRTMASSTPRSRVARASCPAK